MPNSSSRYDMDQLIRPIDEQAFDFGDGTSKTLVDHDEKGVLLRRS